MLVCQYRAEKVSMGSISSTDGEDPGREFRRLGLRTQVAVQRLAVRGRRHPDPAVSRIAYRWARERLRTPLWKLYVTVIIGTSVGVGIVFGVVLVSTDERPMLSLVRWG
jgi:hypothetical protein